MSGKPVRGVTRRTVLVGAGAGAVALAISNGAKASVADLSLFAERRLTIFRDYARWLAAEPQDIVADWPSAPDRGKRILWVSDLGPSSFAMFRDVALVRPSALQQLSARNLAAVLTQPGPVVLSSPARGVVSDQADDRPALWQSLGRLMAVPGTPVEHCLDLGGSGSDDDAIEAGVDRLRQTYAAHATDRIAVRCPQGPRLLLG